MIRTITIKYAVALALSLATSTLVSAHASTAPEQETSPTQTVLTDDAATRIQTGTASPTANSGEKAIAASREGGDDNAALKGCVAAGVGGAVVVLLPGLFTALFDGGLLFFASIPAALKAGTFSCIGGAAGAVMAAGVPPKGGERTGQ